MKCWKRRRDAGTNEAGSMFINCCILTAADLVVCHGWLGLDLTDVAKGLGCVSERCGVERLERVG